MQNNQVEINFDANDEESKDLSSERKETFSNKSFVSKSARKRYVINPGIDKYAQFSESD